MPPARTSRRSAGFLRRVLGPRLPIAPAGLHICPACGGDFANPTGWDTAGDEHWLVGLRCGGCGHERAVAMDRGMARRFNAALDTGYDAIERGAERLRAELMSDWIDTFAAALGHDLIDAADFAASGR
jgi:hypothetical protein